MGNPNPNGNQVPSLQDKLQQDDRPLPVPQPHGGRYLKWLVLLLLFIVAAIIAVVAWELSVNKPRPTTIEPKTTTSPTALQRMLKSFNLPSVPPGFPLDLSIDPAGKNVKATSQAPASAGASLPVGVRFYELSYTSSLSSEQAVAGFKAYFTAQGWQVSVRDNAPSGKAVVATLQKNSMAINVLPSGNQTAIDINFVSNP